MNLPKSKTDLGEIPKNLILTEGLFVVFEVFKHLFKVSSCSILHDNAEFVFGGMVNFFELDDILMYDHFVQLSLEQRLLLLFGF